MAKNFAKLVSAGIIHPEHCSDDHKAAIETLGDHEVDAIISAHGKLSTHLDATKAKDAGQPWIL